jgi:hypothetical protein
MNEQRFIVDQSSSHIQIRWGFPDTRPGDWGVYKGISYDREPQVEAAYVSGHTHPPTPITQERAFEVADHWLYAAALLRELDANFTTPEDFKKKVYIRETHVLRAGEAPAFIATGNALTMLVPKADPAERA